MEQYIFNRYIEQLANRDFEFKKKDDYYKNMKLIFNNATTYDSNVLSNTLFVYYMYPATFKYDISLFGRTVAFVYNYIRGNDDPKDMVSFDKIIGGKIFKGEDYLKNEIMALYLYKSVSRLKILNMKQIEMLNELAILVPMLGQYQKISSSEKMKTLRKNIRLITYESDMDAIDVPITPGLFESGVPNIFNLIVPVDLKLESLEKNLLECVHILDELFT